MSAEQEPNVSETSTQTARETAMTAAVVTGDNEDDADADNGAGEKSYAMFHVRDISPDGAFFAGSLFFELNEEFTAELAIDETTKLRVRARVMSLDYSDAPGMVVAFSDLSASDRAKLTSP